MKKKKSKINPVIRFAIIFVILAAIIVIYYIHLSKTRVAPSEDEYVQSGAVSDVLLRNLSINYPPTPKEVMKYYCEITKCFYNENYTDDELGQMAVKIQEIYDDELVANKPMDQYLMDLTGDILRMKDSGFTIKEYSLSSSVDIENSRFTRDGFEWVKVYCDFTLLQKGQTAVTHEIFLLRKDEEGHWKIFGWQLVEEE